MITTNSGPSQRLVSRSVSVAVVSEARSLTRSPGYRAASACRRRAAAAGFAVCTRIVPSSGAGLVPGSELGSEQRVAERQRPGVDRHDGGMSARPVAEHDRHAVADVSVRGVSALAPERDRVAVQRGQRPGTDARVEPSALSSVEDHRGDVVIGDAETWAKCGGGQSDRRAHAGQWRGRRPAWRPASPNRRSVTASSPVRPACLCWVTAWSCVVVLNSRVQLIATVSTSGVLADEKRRVAVRRFADARNPPTGESRASGGPSSAAGGARHERSEEADCQHEEERGHLRCRCSGVRSARWWPRRRTAAQRRRAPAVPRSRARGRAAVAGLRLRPARESAALVRRAVRRRGRRAARP